jgi:hypothetical protein
MMMGPTRFKGCPKCPNIIEFFRELNTLLVYEFLAFLNLVIEFLFVSEVVYEFTCKNYFDTSIEFFIKKIIEKKNATLTCSIIYIKKIKKLIKNNKIIFKKNLKKKIMKRGGQIFGHMSAVDK